MSSKQILDKIFEYDDYRHFLNDYFDAKKRENPHFSQRFFTQKTGFKAHNFCTFVVQGKRNLSTSSIHLLIKALKLKGKSAGYFENLVYLNQATTIEEKEHFFKKIKKAGKASDFYKLNKEQFFFYEKWYYPVIRELLVLSNWHEDYATLAKMVRPSITPLEAREAVDLLLSSGMVIKKDDGSYSLCHEFVTSEKVPVFIKKKSRRDVLLKGIESIDSIAPEEKYASYATMPLSKKLFDEIRETLDEVRIKILSQVADDTNPDEVYEIVLQVFPVSQIKGDFKEGVGR